jgi:hypothetical protein
MPWDVGTKVFIRHVGDKGQTADYTDNVWEQDQQAGVKVVATRHDYHDQDLADGISACLNKEGVNEMAANLNFGNFKGVNLAQGTISSDAARFGQVPSAMTFNATTRLLNLTAPDGLDLSVTIPGGDAGSGTVTSVDIGEGLSGTNDPITTTGDIKLETIGTLQTFSGGIDTITVDKHGRVTQVVEGSFANTNLAVGTRTSTSLVITSSTGTDVTVPIASTSEAGLLSASDKAVIDSMVSGGIPAILSNGSTPSLNTGITATEIRTLIGAGTGDGDGDITSVSITAGDGLTGGGIGSSGSVSLTIDMGTPGTVTGSSTNSASSSSHTHALSITAGDIGAASSTHTHTESDITDFGTYAEENTAVTFTSVSAGSFNATSARSEKSWMGDLQIDRSLQFIDTLTPFIYALNDDPDQTRQIGLFADEVERFLPEVVEKDKNGVPSGIDYSRLFAPLMLAVQDIRYRLNAAGI